MKEINTKLYNIKNLHINNYNHGGARIFFEDEKGNRHLICDSYADKNNIIEMQIKQTIINSIKNYLKKVSDDV